MVRCHMGVHVTPWQVFWAGRVIGDMICIWSLLRIFRLVLTVNKGVNFRVVYKFAAGFPFT